MEMKVLLHVLEETRFQKGMRKKKKEAHLASRSQYVRNLFQFKKEAEATILEN